MSMLAIYPDDRPDSAIEVLTDGDAIARRLSTLGVRFERWPAPRALADSATQEEILSAYAAEVERLKTENGYQAVDVVRIARGTKDTAPIRQKFLNEHIHSEDEVRFFVEGSGTFCLRIDGKAHMCLCERQDLISVPAGTRHWFDMGAEPYFCAIRLFTDPAGWVAKFSGDPIATRFPTHDAMRAGTMVAA
jgi:1,2-dihydroxy-3-keto-5-methylthiopentene dioxygenase